MFERIEAAERLKQAEERVQKGEEAVSSQKALVAELEKDCQDSKLARALLAEYEQIEATYIADRDRLRAELAQLDATSVGRNEL